MDLPYIFAGSASMDY